MMTLLDVRRRVYELRTADPAETCDLAQVLDTLIEAERGWEQAHHEICVLTEELQELRIRFHSTITNLCLEYERAGNLVVLTHSNPAMSSYWRGYQQGLRVARDTLTEHPDGLPNATLVTPDGERA